MKNFEVRVFSSKNMDEKWYVYIYHNSKIIKKIYKGINSERSFEERMIKAETLKRIIEKEINEGWNPQSKKKNQSMTIFQALEFGLDKKKASLASGSYGEYSIAVNIFKHYGAIEGFDKISIQNCERYHIKTILNAARNDRSWSSMNYNKTLRRYSSIFSELIEWEIITSNPARDIKSLKEENRGGYEVMTKKEQKKAFSHLKKLNFNYYVFCSIVYYMGIRPGELLRLRCKDVDVERKIIKINSVYSKTKKTRVVPIIGTIKKLIYSFDLSDPDLFLFGHPIPGKLPFLKENFFCPNKYQFDRAYPTKLWKREIIDGLKINKKLYSNKHKGASDKLRAGIDIETIAAIFGHSRQKMTELYADYIKELRFEKAQNVVLDEY
ncbi:tyrosine-type recombinase/integrase [Chryseobacterium sp. JV274]|uniref:tyrosine-type recombinase/integrase n=1 Tax=Chryseobacterium sp. JV274 TaxID=1932669 RepID=UPI0015C27F0A|nr:site-specific integrase [Chryseobacterium sp. JV274]CAD0220269.1 Site-specific tyrosine recombinase XerC [Chryseobacterium sp. JV274]